jgi:hypothetical protein
MDVSCPQITNTTNTRMEETGLTQRRMEAPLEEGQDSESAVAPYVDGRKDRAILIVLAPLIVYRTDCNVCILFRGQMLTVCTAHQGIKLYVRQITFIGRLNSLNYTKRRG